MKSKKVIALGIAIVMVFVFVGCGVAFAKEKNDVPDTTVSTTEPSTEPTTQLETETETQPSETESIKIQQVTLKNKKPITQDEAYKQSDKQKEEDKKQEAQRPTDPQEDIKPSRPVRPTAPPETQKPSEPSTQPETSTEASSESDPSTDETESSESETSTEIPTEPPIEPPVIRPTCYTNLPQTKEYAGFGRYIAGRWIPMPDIFHIDNKAVFSQKGIDISIFQREPDKTDVGIDFQAVKKSGIDFVIIRLGARGETSGEAWIDRYFVKNIKEATAAGLKVGVYFYSQAINEAEAIEEAKMCLEAIKEVGCKVEYPVAIDVENNNSRMGKISKEQRTKNVKAFCETIISGGYYPMIYANQSWLDGKLDLNKLPYDIWMACFKDLSKEVKTVFGIDIPFTVWQYGQKTIPGIKTGVVDVNVSLVNYPEFLKKHGWNNL